MTVDPTIRVRGRPVRVRYGKTRITVLQGPDAGLTREIVNTSLRIGSSSDNDLVLTDSTVSRRHCAIEPLSAGVRVRDEGSTNGVMISGVRVMDVIVSSAVHLRLGETVIAVEPLSEQVARQQATTDRFGDLLGGSPRMRELFAELEDMAGGDFPLLVEGEGGTGKELVADSVHRASVRASGPLVVFECGAVTATTGRSELFGYEPGAFPGAVVALPGAFEQADGGTIFLDEIGDLPQELQPELLEILDKGTVTRLGSQRELRVDARVIASTSRNLSVEVARGHFHKGLHARLAQAHVYVPPLRDRMEDLRMLVAHFLSRAQPPRSPSDVTLQVWDMFNAHRWPGNVRELANAVQSLLIAPHKDALDEISNAALDASVEGAGNPILPLRVARREASDAFERQYVETVLARTSGNVTRAAALAEVSRQMIQKLLRKHGIG
jgi:DNA-binding NtrC family response regulator